MAAYSTMTSDVEKQQEPLISASKPKFSHKFLVGAALVAFALGAAAATVTTQIKAHELQAFDAKSNEAVIAGYIENWEEYTDAASRALLDPYSTLLYSFLTLDDEPNPDSPNQIQWEGNAVHETMTLADILEVMELKNPPWDNPHNWLRERIVGLMDYCAANNKKFVWAFGGWSDLTKTISDDQVDLLVRMLVTLLQRHGGDGIDFDWEHLSDHKLSDAPLHAQQRLIVGKVIVALKDSLVAEGLADKLIIYTPRYNGFLENGAYNSLELATDGEAIDVVNYVEDNSAYGVDAIDFVHFMMYDIDAREAFSDATSPCFVLSQYDDVVASARRYIPASKIVMGFYPGFQAYTGEWCGIEHDKATISHLDGETGGIMFWAANRPARASNGRSVAQNSNELAAFAADL